MQRHRRLDLRDVGIDRKDIHEARIICDAEVAEPVTARLSTPAKAFQLRAARYMVGAISAVPAQAAHVKARSRRRLGTRKPPEKREEHEKPDYMQRPVLAGGWRPCASVPDSREKPGPAVDKGIVGHRRGPIDWVAPKFPLTLACVGIAHEFRAVLADPNQIPPVGLAHHVHEADAFVVGTPFANLVGPTKVFYAFRSPSCLGHARLAPKP